MTVEPGAPAKDGGSFTLEPGPVQLSVRGGAQTVLINGDLICTTPDGHLP